MSALSVVSDDQRKRRKPLLAAACMVVFSALIAASTLMAKILGSGTIDASALHPFQISAGRFFFAWLVLLPVVLWKRERFSEAAWKIHIGRSFSGWAGISCLFTAAALIPLADATAISFLNPIITMLLAIPFLGERIGPWRWIAATIALTGGLILIRPGSDTFQPVALIALAAAFFIGLEAIFIKKLTGRERPLQILFINNTIGAAIAITFASQTWVSPSLVQWITLAAIGCVMVSAQSLFITALRCADTSFAIPFCYGTLVFAAIFDFFVFNVVPLAISGLGALLVVGSALILIWREGRHVGD